MRTKRFLHVTVLLLVLLCLAFSICSCSWRYHQQDYTTDKDFPNTIWTCRELDLVIYMIEDCDMCGTYTVNGNEYRVRAGFIRSYRPAFCTSFYSSAEETVSEYDPELIHRNDYDDYERVGVISGHDEFQEDTGLLVLTDLITEPVDGETIPDTLTFEQVGPFTPTPKTRWVAEGLDLYLDSYSDAEWYFKGEITLDGEKRTVRAIEIGNDHYYKLCCPIKGPGALLYLSLDISEDRIVATATDFLRYDDDRYRVEFPVWYRNYKDVKTITFYPTPIE